MTDKVEEFLERLRSLDDRRRLIPPTTTDDPAAWDRYWSDQLTYGMAGFIHMFVDDGQLIDVMRANALRTVLCVGNGISQEPRALAAAGFDVTALDFSPYATEVAERATPPDDYLAGLIGKRTTDAGGQLRFVTGDLRDTSICPGPYDVVIERKTLQLFPDTARADAIRAVAERVASPGIFFSQSHHNREPTFAVADWFRKQGWPFITEGKALTRPTAWFFRTSG